MIKYILTITLLLFSYFSFSQQPDLMKFGIDTNAGEPKGINVGEKAPEFSNSTSSGEIVSLANKLKEGNVVLIFYRGEWCPVCNRYLSNFQDSLTFILTTGATVLAVTPEVASSAEKMKEKTGATFTIIPDTDERIMRDYDVVFDVTEAYQKKILNALEADIAANNSKDKARLPVPATFIINQDGYVVWKQFDPDYHHRATIKEILENLPK